MIEVAFSFAIVLCGLVGAYRLIEVFYGVWRDEG